MGWSTNATWFVLPISSEKSLFVSWKIIRVLKREFFGLTSTAFRKQSIEGLFKVKPVHNSPINHFKKIVPAVDMGLSEKKPVSQRRPSPFPPVKIKRSCLEVGVFLGNLWPLVVPFWRLWNCRCRGLFLSLSFALSGCGKGPLQDEDHFGSRLHSFPGLYSIGSERPPEWLRSGPAVAGSWERDVLRTFSRRAKAPSMRFSVLLNSFDNLFVTHPSISSETWVR